MKRFFAAGAVVAVAAAFAASPQSAHATQALQAGQKISTTSSKLLNKTGTLTGSQQNILICDPPGTPVNGSTSVDYDGFNVHLEDIVAGPGYEVDYSKSWVQLTSSFNESTLKQRPIGKEFLPDDQPNIYYQKLSSYLASGGPQFGLTETGYMQIFFKQTPNPDDAPGAFNTGGEYTGAFSGNSYDLSKYDIIDSDGIQPAGTLTAGGKDATLEFDNYLAVFSTNFTEDPLKYTHYSNPVGPGGEDLLTDPVTGDVYGSIPGEGKGTVVPSSVSTGAPEPTSAALILIGGCVLASRRRRA